MAAANFAAASVITLMPNPSDLNDLDHTCAYTWGVTVNLPDGSIVTDATIVFKNIADWTTEPNVLYVRLFDSAAPGVTTFFDNEAAGDYFAGQGISLVTYSNLTTTATTLTYHFTTDQLATLNQYLQHDNNAALAFDPDCHFYNDGITWNLTTGQNVPEPATLSLLALGGAALLLRRRRRAAVSGR